jgi:hypothetical protein
MGRKFWGLSSLRQPRDASEGNAAQAESNLNFESSGEEEHASDSDGSIASAPEAEKRPMWRLRL